MVQHRILIAEDDEAQAAVLVAAMRHRGYMADIVGDGLEAIRKLRTGEYDLALLDYNIPQINGRAVAQLLQDLPKGVNRPRLIAVTVAADLLNECEVANGSSSFDAVVSKKSGFPALFEVIQQNLQVAVELNNASLRAREFHNHSQVKALQKRRLRALIFALPGLAMAACFAIALLWAGNLTTGIAAAIDSAHFTTALNTDAQVLVGAVAAAQASQRDYLVTGSVADRTVHDADQQRVDRLLSAPTPLNPSGAPGFAESGSPIPVIQTLLYSLGEEADLRSTQPVQDVSVLTTSRSGRAAAEKVRDWAISLVAESQEIVVNSLGLVRQNIRSVTIILIAGFLYGLWNAGAAIWRQFQATEPRVPPAHAGLPMRPVTIDVTPDQHRLH